jgi:hypothetical protein
MLNFIIYKNIYNFTNKKQILNIYLLKNKNIYLFDLVELSKCLNYSSPRYLINYYVNYTDYLKNNFYLNYYTDYEGLEIIANKSRKLNINEIIKDINKQLK